MVETGISGIGYCFQDTKNGCFIYRGRCYHSQLDRPRCILKFGEYKPELLGMGAGLPPLCMNTFPAPERCFGEKGIFSSHAFFKAAGSMFRLFSYEAGMNISPVYARVRRWLSACRRGFPGSVPQSQYPFAAPANMIPGFFKRLGAMATSCSSEQC